MSQAVFDKPRASAAGDTGSEGTASAYARSDHVHDRTNDTTDLTGVASLFRKDTFFLASATPTLTLTYVPANSPTGHSLHVYCGSAVLVENTDYTQSGQTVTILSAAGLATGDQVVARYAYSPDLADASTGYPAEVVADSPLFYYRMNGTGATEVDFMGNGRNGTLSGNYVRSRSGLLTTDTSDAATDFGASNQRVGGISTSGSVVTCPYDAGLITADWSWEFWTNKGSSASTALFVWDGRLRIVVGNTMDVRYFTDATNHTSVAQSTTNLLTGTDYTGSTKYIVVTANATTDEVKFYKDGVQFGSTVTGVTTALRATTENIRMGWCDGSDGMCDTQEFAFYGVALSAADIAAHWAAR